jgi:hypothetical protein
MDRRHFLGGMALGALALTAGATAAPAEHDRFDFRRFHFLRGRDGGEIRRRDVLRDRMLAIADRVRSAARDGAIGRRALDRVFDRLDRVCDFLRRDRYLTDSEFHRRLDDLDQAQEILRDAVRDHRRRHDRYDRYGRR